MFSDDARDELNGFADAGHIGGVAQLWMFPENPRVGTRAQLFWEATNCGAEVRLIGPEDIEEPVAPAGVREILVDRMNMQYTLYAGEQQAFLEVEALVLEPEITRLEVPRRVRANEPFEVLVAASNAQRIQVALFSQSADIAFYAGKW